MVRQWLCLAALAAGLAGCGTGGAKPVHTQAASKPAEAPQPHRYAVLVNADMGSHHKCNVALAYRTLRQLGFEDSGMYVLSPRDRRRPVGPQTHFYKPFPENFVRAMDELAAKVQPGDLVLIYGTGHGDTDQGESLLELRNGELFAGDLRQDVERLRGRTVIIMDQCFSGGFGDAFKGTPSRAIVIATVDRGHMTYCVEFARVFWSSLLHPERADRNHDGKTSVREAFEVAAEANRKELEGDPELRATAEYRSFNGFDDVVLEEGKGR